MCKHYWAWKDISYQIKERKRTETPWNEWTNGSNLKGGVTMGNVYGGGFALIVVLFILLVIVGAAWL